MSGFLSLACQTILAKKLNKQYKNSNLVKLKQLSQYCMKSVKLHCSLFLKGCLVTPLHVGICAFVNAWFCFSAGVDLGEGPDGPWPPILVEYLEEIYKKMIESGT